MPREKILIVDDEEDILELVRFNLEKEGYSTLLAASGEEALKIFKHEKPDAVILDVMLPGIDGLDVLKALKKNPSTGKTPVIMLSAKGEDSDIVSGLELGADDYVTKPFSPKVLIARLRNILRRKTAAHSKADVISVRNLFIDVNKRQLRVGKKSVELTSAEFSLLSHLAGNPGWVFTRGQLIDAVKGGDFAVTERTVDVQIASLRKKLGAAGRNIETVHGIGYRFRE